MKKLNASDAFRRFGKNLFSGVIVVLVSSTFITMLAWVNAMVVDNGGNFIIGQNTNIVNLSNSWAYQIGFTLSGTLDLGNTLVVTARDRLGKTLTNSYLSSSGGESSGMIMMNFSGWSWSDGIIGYSGTLYSGSTLTPVVASGMSLLGTIDLTRPVITLIGSSTVTLTQGTAYTESGATWSDTLDGTGNLSVSNSGSVNTGVVGSSILEYWKTDTAGNRSLSLFRNITITAQPDTTRPLVAVTSHVNNALVTGNPTLAGTMSDTGGIASVSVNGGLATLGSGTWSKILTGLTPGSNTFTVIATDLAGNTARSSLILNRVSATSNINSVFSGTTSVLITFSTDLSVLGTVHYGTTIGILSLTATGTTATTAQSFLLIGLLPDTIYYYTVEWQGGIPSSVQTFKTPFTVGNTITWSVSAIGSIAFSGATGTGITFSGSGWLSILSVSSSGSSVSFPTNNLSILATWGGWDGIIQAPEVTGNPVGLSLSGYAFVGNAYQIGNARKELVFSWQLATVVIHVSNIYSGQVARIFRSTDQGTTYLEVTSCTVSGWGDCTFTTNKFSLFGIALPADTLPDVFFLVGITGVELGTTYTSNTFTVAWVNAQTSISIVGGTYSVNGGIFTPLSGTIQPGDSITVQVVSATTNSATTSATLTIGGRSGDFSVTTKSAFNGGGGGGGGGGITRDLCPEGDYTPSYYDDMCVIPATPGNIINGANTGSFNLPNVIMSLADVNFRDVRGNWAEQFINQLVMRGIIDNVSYYHPNGWLTRAEFLKIVLNTTGWSRPIIGFNLPYNDVSVNSWQAQYVALALDKGMINRSFRFRPNDPISRAEAAKILLVTLWVTVTEPTTMTFIDVNRNSDLAKYIEGAVSINIFSGQLVNGRRIFRPSDIITRAEIAKVMVNTFGL